MTAASVWSQQAVLAIYQATFACWVNLIDNPADVADPAALRAGPKDAYLEPWADTGLPTPDTMYDLLGTMQLLVNAGARDRGPVVELTHPELEEQGLAIGRRVPTILPALCEQLLGWVAEGLPARRCANETCNRLFTHPPAFAIHRKSCGNESPTLSPPRSPRIAPINSANNSLWYADDELLNSEIQFISETEREAFNPDGVCNPGKVIPTTRFCVESNPKARGYDEVPI